MAADGGMPQSESDNRHRKAPDSLATKECLMFQLQLTDFQLIGQGITRPEGVAVSPDGSVWAADQLSAGARVDGPSLMQKGPGGRVPNGINFLPTGDLLIADWAGGVRRLDVVTGELTALAEEVEGRSLIRTNYVVADSAGFIWGTESTCRAVFGPQDVAGMVDDQDGWIFVLRPDGTSAVVADGLSFANGLALSPDGHWLYVAETFNSTVKRGRILRGGTLGQLEDVHVVDADLLDPRPARVFAGADMGPSLDGVGFDNDANLWITVVNWGTLVAVTPKGQQHVVAYDPTSEVLHSPSNVAWGGPDRTTLYVGSIVQPAIAAARVPIPGAPQPWETPTAAAG
jgi:gluconolactonase